LNSTNLILIGFMGSGKSTVGRKLAKEMNTFFLDTDLLIENFENKSIKEIFEKEGEEVFREKERYCFEWIKKDVFNTIVSVGGGFPIFIPEIKEAGIVVYLKVEFEEILKRLTQKEIEKRPLFKDTQKAKELFENRSKTYESLADLIIENNNLDKTIKIIKEYYESFKSKYSTNYSD
jgi:shikimate kinase